MILGNDLVMGGAVIGLGIYGRHSETLSGLADLGNVKMRNGLCYHRVCPFVYVFTSIIKEISPSVLCQFARKNFLFGRKYGMMAQMEERKYGWRKKNESKQQEKK